MKQTPIYEVSEILDTFDLEEIVKLLNSQIDYEQNITIYSNPVDHLKPLYVKYRSIMETEDMPEEAKEEAREKFNNICSIFLCMLCKQYDLEIDQNWIDDHVDDIAGVAMSLYSFFVLDLTSNLYEVCSNYINDNTKYIFDVFEEKKNKKDAVTLVNKKSMTIDKAVILSNIYDVSTWILSQITEEDFFDYLNPD